MGSPVTLNHLKIFLAGLILGTAVHIFATFQVILPNSVSFTTLQSTFQRQYSDQLMTRTPDSGHLVTDIKLLCVIQTSYRETEPLKAILDTWVPQCDDHVIVCETKCGNFTTNFMINGTWSDWEKLKATLRFLHYGPGSFYNTFLFSGAKVHVDVNELKKYLKMMKLPRGPWIVSNMKVTKGVVHPSREPVQVLNDQLMKQAVEGLDLNKGNCKWSHPRESSLLAFMKCLVDIGTTFVDARDAHRRLMFLPQPLSVLFDTNWTSSPAGSSYLQLIKQGPNCCSEFPLAIAMENEADIHTTEFLTQRFALATSMLPRRIGLNYSKGPEAVLELKPLRMITTSGPKK